MTGGKPSALPTAVRTVIVGRKSGVRRGLQWMLAQIHPLGLGPEQLSTIELVLAEALNNIVEHAYPETVPTGDIAIRCTLLADGLHVTITDTGLPMASNATPLALGNLLNLKTSELPEGGFGLYLINDLAQNVSYQRTGGENRLDLKLAISLPS
ncbi:serine/threonine-protein kinase RsbW [Sulfitobacter brevis]|uniref:Serine/threonine-protein kinase RsbW n=2 Tax=Sulfitobacter brevis TaxID=74348 RepID=A0A1I1VQ39_9RHOB|nr:serine/threonine-protein kinase RsbW [Sulfitobacter brevis]